MLKRWNVINFAKNQQSQLTTRIANIVKHLYNVHQDSNKKKKLSKKTYESVCYSIVKG